MQLKAVFRIDNRESRASDLYIMSIVIILPILMLVNINWALNFLFFTFILQAVVIVGGIIVHYLDKL